MRLVIATRSDDKLREIRQILGGESRVELLGLDHLEVAPSPDEDSVEAFLTFRENALAKARYFAELTRLPVLADDSGICVAALNGAPGVLSRRFAAGTGLTGKALDEANNDLLLEKLEGIPQEQRYAHYVCYAAVVTPGHADAGALGTCTGLVLTERRGTGGFGYDPLFLIPQLERTFGELLAHEKHRWSHRARAIRAVAGMLPR